MKYSYTGQSTDCISQSRELWKGWSSLAVVWASSQLAKGKTDEQLEDFGNLFRNQEGDPRQDNLFGLTKDIMYRCNYAATIEGLIGNKMIIDTVFEAPEWYIPFWMKVISLFLIAGPMASITMVDDFFGGTWIYDRITIHGEFGDWFDFGIIGGKLIRILF